MKAWFSAQELALQTLPGLPTTKRKINEVADQQGWGLRTSASGEPLARSRKGKGGGLEYHYTVLPMAASTRDRSERRRSCRSGFMAWALRSITGPSMWRRKARCCRSIIRSG